MNYCRIGTPGSGSLFHRKRSFVWLFVLAVLAVACGSAAAENASPAIGFITEPVRNYEPCLIFGEGFDKDKVEVLFRDSTTTEEPKKLLSKIVQNGLSSPADASPKDGHVHVVGRIRRLSPQVLGAVVQGNATVLWVRHNGALSRPYVVNRPQPYFVEHETLTPGQESRLFGKYLVAQNGQRRQRLWLVGRDHKDIIELPWGTKYDYQAHLAYQLQYELRFRVPAKTPASDYDLWIYNGAGGEFGFGGPLPVRVRESASVERPTVSVKAEGAKGDGHTDDTPSIERAMTALQRKSGGTLYFPQGRYRVSRPIRVAAGINLKGETQELSCILAAADFKDDPPKSTSALVYLAADSTVSHLTLQGNQKTQTSVLLKAGSGPIHDVVVSHCTIRNPYAPLLEPGHSKQLGMAVRVVGHAERVEISHCSLRALAGIQAEGGPFRRCRTLFNNYHAEPKAVGLYGTSQMGWIVGEYCIVEGNLCEYSNRGFTSGPWFGPVEHNFIARNVVAQGGVVEGGGESFLFESGCGVGAESWLGHPSKVGADSLEQSDKKWKLDRMKGRIALVIHGKGFGQYRVIAGNSATQVTFTQPWNIRPDEHSWVVVRSFVFENLLVNNSSRNTSGGLEMGGGLGNVIDRYIARQSLHGIWLVGENVERDPLYMPYGALAYNEVRNSLFVDCGYYEPAGPESPRFSGIKLWSHRLIDRIKTQPMPVIFGNRFCDNQFQRCGILTQDRILHGLSWLPREDARRKAAPPACVYNAMGINWFRGNSADRPDIHLDPWTAGTLLWLPETARGPAPENIKDEGKSTVKLR